MTIRKKHDSLLYTDKYICNFEENEIEFYSSSIDPSDIKDAFLRKMSEAFDDCIDNMIPDLEEK